MRPIISYYFRQMQTKLWWGFLVFLCLCCLKERQAFDGEWSLFILTLLTDPFLIIYVMTLIFLHSVAQVYREPMLAELIRVRHFYRIMLAKWLAVVLFSMIFVGTFVCIVGLFGIGLDSGAAWQGTMHPDFKTFLMESYGSPVAGIVWTIGFMVIGYSFIGCTFVTMAHYCSRKVTYGFIFASYFVMILAFKRPWLEFLTTISMNRFVILHHNFASTFTWQGTILIVVVGLLLQFVLVKNWWYRGEFKQRALGKGLFRYYRRILFARQAMLVWFVGLTILIVMKADGLEETLGDLIVRFFYGYPNGEVHLFVWLEQLAYVGIPIYLFASFMQGWLVKRDWPLYVRLRSKKSWMQTIVALIGLYAVSYVLLSFVLLVTVGLILGKPFVLDGDEVVYILFMKTVEIGLLLSLMYVLFMWTNRVLVAFSGVLLLFVLNLLMRVSFNVAGLGQLARVDMMDRSMLEMGLAGVIYGLLFVSFICFSYKRYFARG